MGSVWWLERGKQGGWGLPKLSGSASPEMCEDASAPAMPNISDDVQALGTSKLWEQVVMLELPFREATAAPRMG